MTLQQFEDELEQWQELDGLALVAEQKLEDLGQLCASSEAEAWVQDAFEKRQSADRYLLRVLRSTKDRSGASDAETRSRHTGQPSIATHEAAACEALL